MATGSYAARIISAVREGLADQIDMDAETVRNVVNVLTYTPQLVALVESGDMSSYAAYQEAKAAKKLQEREARQTQKQSTKQTNLRIKVRREAEVVVTKQTKVRNKAKPRQERLTIGDRRLIWLANHPGRVGRCHGCERDVYRPDARYFPAASFSRRSW
jgi:hypothetical protein